MVGITVSGTCTKKRYNSGKRFPEFTDEDLWHRLHEQAKQTKAAKPPQVIAQVNSLTNQQATRSMQVKDRLLFGRLGLHKAHARSLLGRVRRDIVCRGRSL